MKKLGLVIFTTIIIFYLQKRDTVSQCEFTYGIWDTTIQSVLDRNEVILDLDYLDSILQKHSSYQGLNGFSYKMEFENFSDSLTKEISVTDFGLFLTKVIGQIGDRHSGVRGYKVLNNKFLPFIPAPYEDKVLVLKFDSIANEYKLLFPEYPFLKKINGIRINEFLLKILPEEIMAPEQAYFTRAVKQLAYIEENYYIIGEELPINNEFILTNGNNDTILTLYLDSIPCNFLHWEEKFRRLSYQAKELNDSIIARAHFTIYEDSIGYIRLPYMVTPDFAPNFFTELNQFLIEARRTKALIIDVRSNPGGERHLIWELARYLIHPDSIYVVNIAKQKAKTPLHNDFIEDLHNRFLYSINELDTREKQTVSRFMNSFQPMYNLPVDEFSEYYYAVLNGNKLTRKDNYYYSKPIYILINERSFSAASSVASTFKNISNIRIAGVTTDGSSGNSKKFYLPHSNLKIILSTMVSFQKDGKILDGYGTEPDIEIKRSMNQVLWKEDFQLDSLRQEIKNASYNK